MADTFSSMKSLLANVEQTENFTFELCTSRNSSIKLFAPHGGCIEPGTGPIVRELAGVQFDYFIFRGSRKGGGCKQLLHVTSTHYDEEQCLSMCRSALLSVSVHGCRGKEERIEIGGGNRKFARALSEILGKVYNVSLGTGLKDGGSPRNFINRSVNQGVQLELSEGFRNTLFLDYPRRSMRQNPETFPKFMNIVGSWLREIERELSLLSVL